MMSGLKQTDRKIFDLITRENKRQETTINLIASENYTSKAVREASESVLTNKYAEGYPHKRWYSGTEVVDEVEDLAVSRCLDLFIPGKEKKNWHANVQPYSGTNPNLAVYFATLKLGDTALAMGLSAGGHLSHGSEISISGKIFRFFHYGVRKSDQRIDLDQVRKLAKKHTPKLIVAGASAYSRIIDFAAFKKIADEVGAKLLVDIAHIAGLIVAGVHPSPIPYADFVTSSTQKTLRGPRGGFILCKKEFGDEVDKSLFPGLQGGPLMHIIAAKAVCFQEASTEKFRQYVRQVLKNAHLLAQILKKEDLNLLTGGTDNHLLTVDFGDGGPTGKEVELALSRARITANREMTPFDSRKPYITSGLRLGTPAVTARGMGKKEMVQIGKMISSIIRNLGNKRVEKKVASEVLELTKKFPLS